MADDHIDRIVRDWALARPELDVASVAVIGRILRAARYLEREIERNLADFDLSTSEFNVLGALRRRTSPVAPSELSRALLLSSGGLTKLLGRLESAGLIRRLPDPSDRRGLLVALTDDGLSLQEHAFQAHLENEATLLAPLSLADRGIVAGILRTLLVAFEDADGRLLPRSSPSLPEYATEDAEVRRTRQSSRDSSLSQSSLLDFGGQE
jgi:DNA-binding MarR family transcriptional regulator